MMKIRFTRSEEVGSRRYAVGQVATFSRWVAAALVSRNVAEYVPTDGRETPKGSGVAPMRAAVVTKPALTKPEPVSLASPSVISKAKRDTLLVYIDRLGGTVEDGETLTALRKKANALTEAERARREEAGDAARD